MIITHASAEKIEKVLEKHMYSIAWQGCLCFASEGNTYNLSGCCNYQYNLNVENVIEASDFFYEHDQTEDEVVRTVIDDVKHMVSIYVENITDDEICELIDGSSCLADFDCFDAEIDWYIQQMRGVLAHKLGYDACLDYDEQGAVYIAYCVGREKDLVEIVCK